MRPPVLPSGNHPAIVTDLPPMCAASMRPPVLPSGNTVKWEAEKDVKVSFNEAAGFTQRKQIEG